MVEKDFFYLFEVGIYNCYIYYILINACGDNYSLLEFREALVEQLIQKYKGSVYFLDDDYENKEQFPYYPIRVNEKGSCAMDGCKKDALYIK